MHRTLTFVSDARENGAAKDACAFALSGKPRSHVHLKKSGRLQHDETLTGIIVLCCSDPTMALRNYVQRRNHKERSQPQHRKHLGLLEKHKDYVERARAHHIKRDKLQRLRQKAADRNQDEFYTGMIGKKTERGVHIDSRGNRPLENDVVSLLKTQDAGYLRKQLASERKKYKALVDELAPRVPGMRIALLQKKPDLANALRRAKLLGEKHTSSKTQDRVQGAGKKTKWVDSTEECM